MMSIITTIILAAIFASAIFASTAIAGARMHEASIRTKVDKSVKKKISETRTPEREQARSHTPTPRPEDSPVKRRASRETDKYITPHR
jgi:hypothetical protein